jgi:hypothetical protein
MLHLLGAPASLADAAHEVLEHQICDRIEQPLATAVRPTDLGQPARWTRRGKRSKKPLGTEQQIDRLGRARVRRPHRALGFVGSKRCPMSSQGFPL